MFIFRINFLTPMSSDLEQSTFHIQSIFFAMFQSRIEKSGLQPYQYFQEALDKLMGEYDPNYSEKLKRLMPVSLDLNYHVLRSIYLTKDQRTMIKNFADKASTILGQNVQSGTVMRTAIIDYSGFRHLI